MIIQDSLYGEFRGNPFVIGTTTKNKFYPVYAVQQYLVESGGYYYEGESLMEKIIDDIHLYKKPLNNASRRYGHISRYSDLFDALTGSVNSSVFDFTVNDESYFINCLKGYIADSDDNILMVLCSNSTERLFDGSNLKSNNLRLFVSNELIKNEIYKNIFRKIDSEYISFCYTNDIDVIFTTSEKIESQLFDNEFEVNYSNLTELNEHLNSGIGQNLFFDESVYDEPELVLDDEDDIPF